MQILTPSKLDQETLSFFSQQKSEEYKRSETLIHSGDYFRGVYFLEKGYVKMTSLFDDGRELIMDVFSPGVFFPVMSSMEDRPSDYYYQAISPLTIRRVSKNSFNQHLEKYPNIQQNIYQDSLLRYEKQSKNLSHLLSGNAYKRIIFAVLFFTKLSDISEIQGNEKVIISLPLTHQDIANISGVTRETASLVIKRLEEKDLISHHYRQLTINNVGLLEKEYSEFES